MELHDDIPCKTRADPQRVGAWRLDGRGDQGVDVGLVGDVDALGRRRSSRVCDELGGLGRGGVVDVGADDGGAGFGQAARDGAADAASRAGDDGDAVREVERFGDRGHNAAAYVDSVTLATLTS